MDTLTTESRRASTVADGREIPEEEVARGDPQESVFQVREAVTVRQGSRRRGSKEEPSGQTLTTVSRSASTVADGREIPEEEVARGDPQDRVFQVREAATVFVTPPHWAQLPKPEKPEEAIIPEPPAPREIQTPAAGKAGGDARPTKDKEE